MTIQNRRRVTGLDNLYEPHLTLKEFPLLPGGEWLPRSSGWLLIQVVGGSGYWLQAQSSVDLTADSVLLVAAEATGRIRASQLNGISLCVFNIIPERLTGLITMSEREILAPAASRPESAARVFPPQDPIAIKIKELRSSWRRGGLRSRLVLLKLFVDVFGKDLEQTPAAPESTDARERLRAFLSDTPPDALLEVSAYELARATHCTPRHLSRIFFELTGMSFRDKRAEIRLARARELLATSKSKVVEVALESGYKSLSLFNLMFTRRFGTSPGRWRQKHGVQGGKESYRNRGRRFALG